MPVGGMTKQGAALRSTDIGKERARRRRWPYLGLRLLGVLLVVLAVAYVAVSAYAAAQIKAQRHLPNGTPADVGLTFEAVSFESTGDHIPLKGWYLPAGGRRAIILVHGLDGNRWDSNGTTLPRLVPRFVQDGYDVFLFDLRAHGESGGNRVGLGWYERQDVQGAVGVVEQHGVPAGHIGLFGQSFGGATALLSAAVIPDVSAVVTDSAFADVRPVLDREIQRESGLPAIFSPGVAFFGGIILGINFDEITPVRAVPQIAPRPIFFIHGTADARIPVEHAYQLKAASHNPADELWIVPGAGHIGSFPLAPDEYTMRIMAFWERYVP